MSLEMYIGITGAIICCTIAVVSMLWGINNSLKALIKIITNND